MDEHSVKDSIKSDGAHVTFDVFAFRIEQTTYTEHLRRMVNQGHIKGLLQVGGVIATTRPQFKHGLRRGRTGYSQNLLEKSRFI